MFEFQRKSHTYYGNDCCNDTVPTKTPEGEPLPENECGAVMAFRMQALGNAMFQINIFLKLLLF